MDRGSGCKFASSFVAEKAHSHPQQVLYSCMQMDVAQVAHGWRAPTSNHGHASVNPLSNKMQPIA